MAGRDRISGLPADLLDKILGFLPIEEAARMAILSTLWRDIWFSLTHLNFDASFFIHIEKKYCRALRTQNRQEEMKKLDMCASAGLYVIHNVLMQHNGLTRKFSFSFCYLHRTVLSSRSFDFDQWLLFLTQKGVEDISLTFSSKDEYRLPNIIFSCPTLRKLCLGGVSIEPTNSHCTLPNVTSLCFEGVDFGGGYLTVDVPMLKNLLYVGCDNLSNFNITAQKLDSLTIHDCHFDQLPVNLDLSSVRTLDLESISLQGFINGFTTRGLQLQLPTLNVEHLMLSAFYDSTSDISSAFIHLLRICPKLRQLDIDLDFSQVTLDCFDAMQKLREEFRVVAQRHKMLHTLKLNSFIDGEDETLFIKGLLACFPALEKVVINPFEDVLYFDEDFQSNMEELLHFPCASTKAKVIFNPIVPLSN